MSNKIIGEWCRSHNVRVLDTHKRASKISGMNMKYFQFAEDYNKVVNDLTYLNLETEPLYTVEISESELEKIAEFESQVFNHLKNQGHFNFFGHLMEQKEKEKELKNRYPAVQKAYEQYSLLLKLAESGNLK